MPRAAAKPKARSAIPPRAPAGVPGVAPMMALARQLKGWADSVVAMAGPATDLVIAATGAKAADAQQRAAIHRGGALLRRMREAAGLTLQDVSRAIDLRDPELLESAEGGVIALPFEVVLRLAAVVGRDDPVAALMKLTRSYNPDLWRTLEQLGLGRLVVQAGRERELANIYRASDKARRLSDEDFAAVLGFTQQAFEMAVDFRRPATRAKAA
jgi:hypothetical protein